MYTALFERLREYYTEGKYGLFKTTVEEIPFKFFRRHILKKFTEYIVQEHYVHSVFTTKELYDIIRTNVELDI